jgi:hypothetical protein
MIDEAPTSRKSQCSWAIRAARPSGRAYLDATGQPSRHLPHLRPRTNHREAHARQSLRLLADLPGMLRPRRVSRYAPSDRRTESLGERSIPGRKLRRAPLRCPAKEIRAPHRSEGGSHPSSLTIAS